MVYRNCVITAVLFIACASGLWAQPYDKEYYYTRAQQYMSQGNLSGALEIYNLLIGLDPADAKAFNGRGLVYERRLDLNAAMIDYEHALELNPTYAEALHNRAALLQKYKNDKPPSITFAPQGISRNETIFSQTSMPTAGTQARQSAAAQSYPPPYTPQQPVQQQPAAVPQVIQPRQSAAAQPVQAQRPPSTGAAQSMFKSPAETARSEQWQPVREEQPRYTPRESEVTPGYFRQDTGYGEDSRYLGPSNYPQPATNSRTDGTLVRITPTTEQAWAQAPPPPVRPARFPRPNEASSNQNNPPVFDMTPSRPEGRESYRQSAAETPRAASPPLATSPLPAAAQPPVSRPPASRLPATTASPVPRQSYIPPPSYTQERPSYTQELTPYTQERPLSTQERAPSTQDGTAGKSGGGQAGQTATYPGNVVITQNSAHNTPAPSARLSPMLVTKSQGAFPVDGSRLLRDAWEHNNAGLVFFNAGNYQQAITEFDQAIKIEPHFALAYNNRGAAYAQLGQVTHAVDDFNNALRINPYYTDAQQNRALLLPILLNSGK